MTHPILLMIIASFILFSVAAIIVNYKSYRFYRLVYDDLPFMKFRLNFDQVYGSKGFTWFLEDNEFCLRGNHYLLSGLPTNFDPFKYYWLCKYRRWFRKNVNINSIEKY